MANLVDKSGDASSNLVRQTSGTSISFSMPGNVPLDVESVVATIDNTAGAATTATLVVRDSSGEVVATKRMGDTFPAGDTGTVTFSLRNTDSSSTSGTGIQYDVDNVGGWLSVETTSARPVSGFGIDIHADGAPMFLHADNELDIESSGGVYITATGSPGDFAVQTAHDVRVDSGRLITLDAADAFTVNADSGDLEFDNDSQVVSGGALLVQGALNVQLASGATAETISPTGSRLILPAGGTLDVWDHLGNPVFRVNEDGSLQGKTGKALTFNL